MFNCCPSPVALQKLLNICSDFAMDHMLYFNDSKTKCMCFKPRCLRNLHVPMVFLNDTALVFVNVNKYLNIHISCDMNDEPDMKRHVKSLYAKGNFTCISFKKIH